MVGLRRRGYYFPGKGPTRSCRQRCALSRTPRLRLRWKMRSAALPLDEDMRPDIDAVVADRRQGEAVAVGRQRRLPDLSRPALAYARARRTLGLRLYEEAVPRAARLSAQRGTRPTANAGPIADRRTLFSVHDARKPDRLWRAQARPSAVLQSIRRCTTPGRISAPSRDADAHGGRRGRLGAQGGPTSSRSTSRRARGRRPRGDFRQVFQPFGGFAGDGLSVEQSRPCDWGGPASPGVRGFEAKGRPLTPS